MYTPWGQSDSQTRLGDGITFYGTPSHGGIKVDHDIKYLVWQRTDVEKYW